MKAATLRKRKSRASLKAKRQAALQKDVERSFPGFLAGHNAQTDAAAVKVIEEQRAEIQAALGKAEPEKPTPVETRKIVDSQIVIEKEIPIPPTKPKLAYLAEFTHERQVQIARQRLAHERATNPNPKRPYYAPESASGWHDPYGTVSQNIANEKGSNSKAQRFFGWPDDSI